MSELRLEAGIFSNFLKLMELRIVRSGMRAVPADLVRGSRSLFFLSLEDNLLTELPGEMLYQQRDLRTLSLARNRLRSLPYKLFTMIWTLTKLDLSENAIEFLPNNIFEENQSLRTLNLNHNNLQQLEPELLKPMYNLVKLSLAHNVLASVDLAAFADYSELKSVDLSHNVITQLSDSELNLKINAKFDLSNNNISKLFLENLDPIVGEASIILNNNPVVCDCKLFNFVRVLKEPNFARRFYLDHAFCGAPASLSDKLLSTVTVDELICELDTPPCPEHCACTLRPAAARLELDCPAAPSELPPLAPLNATSVHLRLHTVPDDLAALPPEVRLVDISGLGLTVAPRTLSRLDNLTIDIRNNNLTIAPISLLKANAIIRLAGNRFECDCDHRDSIATLELYSTQLEDRAQLQCRNGDRVMRTPAERLCTMRNAIVLGSTMVALGLILAVVGLLAFRYSTEIRLVLRRYEVLDFLFEEPPDPTELEEQYDAFVSFTHRDDDFVQDELVPQLEGGRRPLRLCLHYRDWEIGGMIPEQIARSVSESRRTIVVMSREFLVSKWGRMEFRAAHALDRVILLLRGDVLSAAREDPELRAYLTSNTYVHADDPLVWDRVRDAVLRSRRPRPPAVPALPAPPAAPALTQPQPPLPLQS
ncbi:protein toll-like [Epargyreus clarus]|uniref:protein toll-like n=1 Tax=Epargyreus clarus TaxID=520877 RepID=UPI003C2E79CC